MPDSRLQAILAALLPLLPLLFPDDEWPWVPVPFQKAPVLHYISASFSVESFTKAPVALELNTTLTPEVLADALTESWDDAPPVIEALETLYESLQHHTSRLNIPMPLGLAGAAIFLVLLVAVAARSWCSRRKLNTPQHSVSEQVPPVLGNMDDAYASPMVDSIMTSACGEQTRPPVLLLSGPPASRLEVPSSAQSMITPEAAAASLVQDAAPIAAMPPSSHSLDVSPIERASSPSTPPLSDSAPCHYRSPSSLSQGDANQGASHHNTILEHDATASTVHSRSTSPVSQSSVLSPVQSASPVEHCLTSQLTGHIGSPSSLPADDLQHPIPPRSSWSLEKACEKAPFEATIPVSPAVDGYATAPSSPQPLLPAQPHAVLEPRFFLPQPPVSLTREQLRAAPPLITDEVIDGVPTDVSEKTEEPDSESDHGSPGTPRARWYSGIRGRLTVMDDHGITYGAKRTGPTDGVMSSPETDTPATFPLMMPQPLLGAVMSCPLLATGGSKGLGLDVASDEEGPEDSDHSEDEAISDPANRSPAVDSGDSDDDSNSSAVHVLRSDSPSSILTVMPDSEEARFSEAASAAEPLYTPVDIDASNNAYDALEAAEVEGYLSSPFDFQCIEAPSRGCSPEPVQLAASVSPDSESTPQVEPPTALSSGGSNEPPTSTTVQTPLVRKVSRSHSRRNSSVVVASSGLVGSRPFALTPKGIDYAAEQLEAEVAAGEWGRRDRRESITIEAMAKHADQSRPHRDYEPFREERRNHLEHVPARVDRDILDGARYPPLASDAQERRAVCEIGRSRTKTIARATSSVRLEANPASVKRSRTASAPPSSKMSRASSEPPMQRDDSECHVRDRTVTGQSQRPPKLARTSYSDIVAQSKCRGPRSRTQSERSVVNVSAVSAVQDSTTTSPSMKARSKAGKSSTREHAGSDRKGKGRAIDETAAAEVPMDLARSKPPLQLSNGASEFSFSEPVRQDTVELEDHSISSEPRKVSTTMTGQLRHIYIRATAKTLLNGKITVHGPNNGESGVAASASTSSRPESQLVQGASCDSLSGSPLGSSASTISAPLRLPTTSGSVAESPGNSSVNSPALRSQGPVPQDSCSGKNFKSLPLLPRRDRLPSALGQPALSFATFQDVSDEKKYPTAIRRDDSPWSPSLGSSVTVQVGSSSSLTSTACDSHIRQSSAPTPTPSSPNVPITLTPFSPSASQAGFSSDEGEQVVMRPNVPPSSSWMFDTLEGADAGMPNRGHQTVPRARRRASTNSMSVQATGETEGSPGLGLRSSPRFTGGRFDGMRRNVLIR